MIPISILIITKDESANLPRCIASVKDFFEVVVFDSCSCDGTQEIARSLGARVFERPFDNYGKQREAARVHVDWKTDWVLSLDADEEVAPDLLCELSHFTASTDSNISAFRLCRKDYFKGQWIKRATLYPSWHVRLFRHKCVRYPDRSVHEYPDINGKIGVLGGHLIHHNFSKGMKHWWERHLHYASLEAAEFTAEYGSKQIDWGGSVSLDPVRRRRSLKSISYRLPLRPFLRWAYMMFFRGALLDGPVSWEYCHMISQYQRITDQFIDEYRRAARKLPL